MNRELWHRRQLLASLAVTGAVKGRLNGQENSAYVPKQTDRPVLLESDEEGFASIFDGQTLSGWAGDEKHWRVADGVMVGEIRPETVIRSNTFLIWQGGAPEDFELKVDYRITAAGNSGINYRSVVVEDAVTPGNRFAMRGYQCDLDGKSAYTGNNYEEKGRLFLAQRGEVTHVTGLRKPVIVSRVGENETLRRVVREGWNAVHLMARGNVLTHEINGQLMSMVIDDDPQRRKKGQIGVQVHVGPPMMVEFRNWRIKVYF